MRKLIEKIANDILKEREVSPEDIQKISRVKDTDIFSLIEGANRIREKFRGKVVDLCAIVNAKSGSCSEDCIFCSQSAHHKTKTESFSLISAEEILEKAREAVKMQATGFGIVTSGRKVEGKEISVIGEGLQLIKKNLNLRRCASLGMLTRERARLLKEQGLERYHHNLESSESFFPEICTTHRFQDRVRTIKIAKEAGFEVCSGGIFGLGETFAQRLELAFTLKELEVDSIPLNFLHPVPGTPCENFPSLPALDILKTIALFRFVLPDRDIKVCGGREKNLRSLQSLIFPAGANGMLIGNYLTTSGGDPNIDLRMIRDLGFKVKKQGN